MRTRPPNAIAAPAALKARFDGPLPEHPRPAREVIEALAAAAEPGLMGTAGPAFYGWVMGASHPAGVAADWLASAWGQNAALYCGAPAAAAAEDVAARWLLELLDLPRGSGVGLTTGATMAGFTCLAAARLAVLDRAGWNIDEDGVFGAPEVKVFLGEEAHSTIYAALRYLGFGERNFVRIAADAQGLMAVDDLAARLGAYDGPKIIVAQAGHINSGGFDRFREIAALSRAHDAWLHVDGAFGLWARVADDVRHLCDGVDEADSWSVDAHKWLQAPYDTGFAIVRDAAAHRRAMRIAASYLNAPPDGQRDNADFVPELSRRARGFPIWALIQALGRSGIEDLVSRHCLYAKLLKMRLGGEAGIEILNDVVLNQVAISFSSAANTEEDARLTDQVIGELQRENRSFVSGADWKGRRILRVSIISGETTEGHIEALAESIIAAWRRVRPASIADRSRTTLLVSA